MTDGARDGGTEKAAQLMEWNNSAPPTYARVNRLKTDAAKLAARWEGGEGEIRRV